MKKYRTLIASLIVTIGLIGGAIYLRSNQAQPQTAEAASQSTTTTFSLQELATFDGKNGHKCYVAVEHTVYEIEQGRLWVNGEHTTAEGQAYCGQDLSEAIKKSPHGTSKLPALETVGQLRP